MTAKKPTPKKKVQGAPNTAAQENVTSAVVPLRERTTLITTGMRAHVPEDFERGSYAELDLDAAPPKTADELWERWHKELERAKRAGSLVPGAGRHGIASGYLREQVQQLALPEHVWFMSNGLGLVNMARDYPQYHLGKMESDIRKFPGMDPDALTEREWWNKLVGGGWGSGFTEVVANAVEKGHRVLITVVSINYYVIADDLARLTQRMAEDKDFDAQVISQLRLVGQGIDMAVPAPLLPCVMPFDSTALARLVPGSRTNSLRRMAFLLQKVTEDNVSARGASEPLLDAKRLSAEFANGTQSWAYQSFSDPRVANRSLISDTELIALMRDYYLPRVGNNIPRIIRMLKHNGHNVARTRIEDAVRRAQGDAE